MSRSLAAFGVAAIADDGVRRYELGLPAEAALDLVRAEAGKTRGTEPLIVVGDGVFTVYKPWRSASNPTEERALGGDFAMGPAVVGRLVSTSRGSRLELRVKRWAPTPAERFTAGIAVVSWALFVAAPILFAGLHPVAIGLSAIMLVGGLASLIAHDRRRRSQDIRDLLAIVERTFGPLELPAGQDAPHRRDDG